MANKCIEEVINQMGKHKFSDKCTKDIDDTLQRYAEKESTKKLDELGEEGIAALGEEVLKKMLEEWLNSEEFDKLMEEAKDSKKKYENDKHDVKTGRFAPKNGGSGSPNSKDKKEPIKNPTNPSTMKKVGGHVWAAAKKASKATVQAGYKPVQKIATSLENTFGATGAKLILGAGIAALAGDVFGVTSSIGSVGGWVGTKLGTIIAEALATKSGVGAGAAGAGTSAPSLSAYLSNLKQLAAAGAGTSAPSLSAYLSNPKQLAAAAAPILALGALPFAGRFYNIKKQVKKDTKKEIEIAKKLADDIWKEKDKVDTRERVGTLAEEIAHRVGEHEDIKRKVTKSVEKEAVNKETKRQAAQTPLRKVLNKIPLTPPIGETKGPITEDIKSIRKEVQHSREDRAKEQLDKILAKRDAKSQVELSDTIAAHTQTGGDKQGPKQPPKTSPPRPPGYQPKPMETVNGQLKPKTTKQLPYYPPKAGDVNNPHVTPVGGAAPKLLTHNPQGTTKNPHIPPSSPPPQGQGAPKTPPQPKTGGGASTAPQGNSGNKLSPVEQEASSAYWKAIEAGKTPRMANREALDLKADREALKPSVKTGGQMTTDIHNPSPGIKPDPLGTHNREAVYTRTRQTPLGPVSKEVPGIITRNNDFHAQPSTRTAEEIDNIVKQYTQPSLDLGTPGSVSNPHITPVPQARPPISAQVQRPIKSPVIEQLEQEQREKTAKKLENKKKNLKNKKHDFSMKAVDKIVQKYSAIHSILKRYDAGMVMPGSTDAFIPTTIKKKTRFDNESDFELWENIPIFRAHDGKDEGLDINFDEEMLQKIIDRCNERIESTEDYPTIIDGHTETDDDESRDVLGFASNFRMGEIDNKKPVKAIYADFHIKRDKLDKARSLNRRSIELWHKDLTADPIVLDRSPIDKISMLGDTRPALDLGLTTYSKEKCEKNKSISNKYKCSFQMEKTMNPGDLKQILEAVMSLPCMAWCDEQMNKQADESAKLAYDEEHKEEGLEEKPVPAEGGGEDQEKADFAEEEKKPEEGEVGEPKLRMEYDQTKRRYAKLEAEHKALASKIADIESKERYATRKADLMQLDAEGYCFDLPKELDGIKDLEPARYSMHLSTIRENYRQKPLGLHITNAVVPTDTKTKSMEEVKAEAYKKAQEKWAK